MSPAVHDGGDVGASELHVHNAVDQRVDAGASPERQRREHVNTAVEHGASVGQVCDGERQVGESEREEDGENHVQRMRAVSVTARLCRRRRRQFRKLVTAKQSTATRQRRTTVLSC